MTSGRLIKGGLRRHRCSVYGRLCTFLAPSVPRHSPRAVEALCPRHTQGPGRYMAVKTAPFLILSSMQRLRQEGRAQNGWHSSMSAQENTQAGIITGREGIASVMPGISAQSRELCSLIAPSLFRNQVKALLPKSDWTISTFLRSSLGDYTGGLWGIGHRAVGKHYSSQTPDISLQEVTEPV